MATDTPKTDQPSPALRRLGSVYRDVQARATAAGIALTEIEDLNNQDEDECDGLPPCTRTVGNGLEAALQLIPEFPGAPGQASFATDRQFRLWLGVARADDVVWSVTVSCFGEFGELE